MLSGKPAALAILTVKHGGASIIFSNIYGDIFLKPNPFVELSPGCLHDAVLDMFSNKLWILPRRCVFNSFFFFFSISPCVFEPCFISSSWFWSTLDYRSFSSLAVRLWSGIMSTITRFLLISVTPVFNITSIFWDLLFVCRSMTVDVRWVHFSSRL